MSFLFGARKQDNAIKILVSFGLFCLFSLLWGCGGGNPEGTFAGGGTTTGNSVVRFVVDGFESLHPLDHEEKEVRNWFELIPSAYATDLDAILQLQACFSQVEMELENGSMLSRSFEIGKVTIVPGGVVLPGTITIPRGNYKGVRFTFGQSALCSGAIISIAKSMDIDLPDVNPVHYSLSGNIKIEHERVDIHLNIQRLIDRLRVVSSPEQIREAFEDPEAEGEITVEEPPNISGHRVALNFQDRSATGGYGPSFACIDRVILHKNNGEVFVAGFGDVEGTVFRDGDMIVPRQYFNHFKVLHHVPAGEYSTVQVVLFPRCNSNGVGPYSVSHWNGSGYSPNLVTMEFNGTVQIQGDSEVNLDVTDMVMRMDEYLYVWGSCVEGPMLTDPCADPLGRAIENNSGTISMASNRRAVRLFVEAYSASNELWDPYLFYICLNKIEIETTANQTIEIPIDADFLPASIVNPSEFHALNGDQFFGGVLWLPWGDYGKLRLVMDPTCPAMDVGLPQQLNSGASIQLWASQGFTLSPTRMQFQGPFTVPATFEGSQTLNLDIQPWMSVMVPKLSYDIVPNQSWIPMEQLYDGDFQFDLESINGNINDPL